MTHLELLFQQLRHDIARKLLQGAGLIRDSSGEGKGGRRMQLVKSLSSQIH